MLTAVTAYLGPKNVSRLKFSSCPNCVPAAATLPEDAVTLSNSALPEQTKVEMPKKVSWPVKLWRWVKNLIKGFWLDMKWLLGGRKKSEP